MKPFSCIDCDNQQEADEALDLWGNIPPCNTGKGHVKLLVVLGQKPTDPRYEHDLCMACADAFIEQCQQHDYFTKILEILPVVGLGATIGIGSDRYPATIVQVEVNSKGVPSRIGVQADTVQGYDKNGYGTTFARCPSAPIDVWTLRKNGCWKRLGETGNSGYCLGLGKRSAYHDPSF